MGLTGHSNSRLSSQHLGNLNKNIKRVGTFLINIFRIIMFIGAGILLFNAIARPENAFLFMALGVLLVIGGGVMILRQNKK